MRPPRMSEDEYHEHMMRRGSEELARAIELAQRGMPTFTADQLIWGQGTGTSGMSKEMWDRLNDTARTLEMERQRVNSLRSQYKGPCPKCGAARGCKHR